MPIITCFCFDAILVSWYFWRHNIINYHTLCCALEYGLLCEIILSTALTFDTRNCFELFVVCIGRDRKSAYYEHFYRNEFLIKLIAL